MEHTEILDEYRDIVTVRHRDGVEIAAKDIWEILERIIHTYPHKKLVLIDHCHSYSLDQSAMLFLQGLTDFKRMASVVYNARILSNSLL